MTGGELLPEAKWITNFLMLSDIAVMVAGRVSARREEGLSLMIEHEYEVFADDLRVIKKVIVSAPKLTRVVKKNRIIGGSGKQLASQ